MAKLYNIFCRVCGQSKKAYGGRATTCGDCITAGYKYCSHCDTVLPVSAFGYAHTNKDGLQSHCKECNVLRTYDSRYTLHPDTDQEYWDKARAANRCSKAKRIADPARYEQHKEYNREYYSYNQAGNKEFKVKQAIRTHTRRSAGGSYTAEEWQDCLTVYDYECAYCGEKHNLTIDHIVAVSKGGYNYAFNLVPACAHCNSSKGAKDVVEWYSAQPFYDEDKLRNIHKRYRVKQQELLNK